ncbi:molybdopterin-guanine dinucleotide biosynthesis protein MobB [Mucilaginibacter achroorhodeus]|uniref:Molybdopterin-guanine dinucleotide biosynthesis protein MobB n=1 Tax=Mucilaginibacter achroorhodeus TaxID=2599294 RepID=A0A563UB56_9SPHI|nr:DUF5712 family protein [Mucilaginibacter achroorhodeus]TWR28575.1 molybdopterin-guanine dinucleotide biosynthesis protein MobB [Mucilaginibacter achroorhodeus]
MFINITDSKTADNKGSAGGLVNYLEKENRLDNAEHEYWFNQTDNRFAAYEVRQKIDSNAAKLGRNDAKFFLINISPSQKELNHLFAENNREQVKELLKGYAVLVMDEYAHNFNRPNIKDSNDLIWFAKLENHRYYSYDNKEVKQGLKKRGERKPGEQMHIQIIVSRKDASNTVKLSPMNNSRGRNVEHSKKMGEFDRVAFKQSGEHIFDQHFKFDRDLHDTMAYANVIKNGSLEQRRQMDILSKGEQFTPNKAHVKELAEGVTQQKFTTPQKMMASAGTTIGKFLDVLLEQAPIAAAPHPDRPKKKKKKGQGYSY